MRGPKIVTSWDQLPPVVVADGELFSTRVLEERYRKMEMLLRNCRLFIVFNTGYHRDRNAEVEMIRKEMEELGI